MIAGRKENRIRSGRSAPSTLNQYVFALMFRWYPFLAPVFLTYYTLGVIQKTDDVYYNEHTGLLLRNEGGESHERNKEKEPAA